MPVQKSNILKSSVVTNIERKPDDDNTSKYGQMMYKYYVEMENGDKGMYSSLSPDKPKFVKGEKANYYLDVMTSLKNVNFKSFLLRYDNGFKKDSNSYKKKTPEEQKSIIYNVVLSSSLDFFIEYYKAFNTKVIIENEIINKVFNIVSLKVFNENVSNIDVDSILYCSAIKLGFKQYLYSMLCNKDSSINIDILLKNIHSIKEKLNYGNFKD